MATVEESERREGEGDPILSYKWLHAIHATRTLQY
jgi:hypothetical protein